MNKRTLVSIWLLLLCSLFLPRPALASSLIGLDINGQGNFVYSDLWTNRTDSGLLTGYIPGRLVPPEGAYQTGFIFQTRIGTLQNNGQPVVIPALALKIGRAHV